VSTLPSTLVDTVLRAVVSSSLNSTVYETPEEYLFWSMGCRSCCGCGKTDVQDFHYRYTP